MAQFFLIRWFTRNGWIGKLFQQKPGGTVNVKDAATKTADALDAVLMYEAEIDLIADSISDNAGATVDEVVEELKEVRDDLRGIATLPDIAADVQDYHFSDDPETDHFIKDMVTTVAVAMNDLRISPFEAAGIVARTIAFIKLKNDKVEHGD